MIIFCRPFNAYPKLLTAPKKSLARNFFQELFVALFGNAICLQQHCARRACEALPEGAADLFEIADLVLEAAKEIGVKADCSKLMRNQKVSFVVTFF